MTKFEVLGIEIKEKTIKMNALSNLVNKKMKMYAFLRLQKKWIQKVVDGNEDGMWNVQYFSPHWNLKDKNNWVTPFRASEGSKVYNASMLFNVYFFLLCTISF